MFIHGEFIIRDGNTKRYQFLSNVLKIWTHSGHPNKYILESVIFLVSFQFLED
jgi:hypothetical protein